MHRMQFLSMLFAFAIPMPLAAQDMEATFYRAINLNGPALVIDGHSWESGNAENLQVEGEAFENDSVPLKPATDPIRAKMIRSSRWGNSLSISMGNIPIGVYQVFVYVWEDNDPEEYAIQLNGKTVVARHRSGMQGEWKRLGPWRTTAKDGRITLTARGGAANISGIEVWSGSGGVPGHTVAEFVF